MTVLDRIVQIVKRRQVMNAGATFAQIRQDLDAEIPAHRLEHYLCGLMHARRISLITGKYFPYRAPVDVATIEMRIMPPRMCVDCKIVKPPEDFRTDSHQLCKVCVNERRNEARARTREHTKRRLAAIQPEGSNVT